MRSKLMYAACAALVLTGLVLGFAGGARADDPPAHFFDRAIRLEVNLEDVSGSTFSATLNNIPGTVPYSTASYLSQELGTSSFDVESSGARCFLVSDKARSVPCAQLATMVDESADGGVDATILAWPTRNDVGDLAFNAKKITVWVDASGNDVPPPPDAEDPVPDPQPVPAPPKFFQKNLRLNVNLQDENDGIYDAELSSVPSSVPSSFASYLYSQLDGFFEIDATGASCYVIKHIVPSSINCSKIADFVNWSADGGLDATILAKPVAGNELSFKAKRITVWL